MRKNMQKVIDAFRNRVSTIGDSKRTCWTDGNEIYSYAMLIGFRGVAGDMFVCDYECAPSATTRTHVRALEVAFPTATRFTSESPIANRNRVRKSR